MGVEGLPVGVAELILVQGFRVEPSKVIVAAAYKTQVKLDSLNPRPKTPSCPL